MLDLPLYQENTHCEHKQLKTNDKENNPSITQDNVVHVYSVYVFCVIFEM